MSSLIALCALMPLAFAVPRRVEVSFDCFALFSSAFCFHSILMGPTGSELDVWHGTAGFPTTFDDHTDGQPLFFRFTAVTVTLSATFDNSLHGNLTFRLRKKKKNMS